MRSIPIGQAADGKPVQITAEMRQSTHMHVIGGSGTGKSKFLEWMIRKDIREGNGLCLIDWHGTLYQDVINYCANLDVGLYNDFRSLILLNPSRPDFVTGFNPFMNQGDDIATQVANRIAATIRPWGITDTNLMPTFERICRLLYTFAVEQQQTLPNAAQLLQFEKPELRDYAVEMVSDPYIKEQWRQLRNIKTFRDWKEFVLSTENRLGRFLASKTIRRFFGLAENNINLREIMDKQQILLINLGSSGYLDRESARVFASLLLNEFFETGMLRANEAPRGQKPKTFTLYLDEFQEYITDDIASMLDQVRKGGLHMVLAHQHLGHLADNPRLLESILVNARIRAVFGGLSYKDACELANEMFLPDLNERQIKKAYYHTTHLYEEQTRRIRSHGSSRSTSTSSNWAEGSSRTTGRGTSSSTSHTSTSGSSAGSGFSVGGSTTTPGQPNVIMPPDQTEGWFTESKGESGFSSTSQSESYGSSTGSSYSESESESYSEGGSISEGYTESESESVVPVWVPIPVQELGSEAEWSREEKVSKVAEMLKTQQQRHCFIKLDTEKTQPLRIPFVKDYSQSSEYLLEYEQEVYRAQGALPASTVDQLLSDSEQRFLKVAYDTATIDIEAADVTGDPITEESAGADTVKQTKAKASAQSRKKPQKPNIYATALDPNKNDSE